jgi:hypothetical protein
MMASGLARKGTIFAGEAGVLNGTPGSLGGFFIWYVGTDFAHLG